MKKTVQKIENVLFIGAAALLLFALAFSLFVRASSAGKDTTFFGYKPLHIVSGSMEPTIRTGSIILCKRADFNTLKVGDVISYDNGSELITHRIAAVDPDGSLTAQGDANPQADDYRITASDVKFVLVATMNWTASINTLLHSPAGIALIALLLADIVQFVVIMLLVKRGKQRAAGPTREDLNLVQTELDETREELSLKRQTAGSIQEEMRLVRAELDEVKVELYLKQLDKLDLDKVEDFFFQNRAV